MININELNSSSIIDISLPIVSGMAKFPHNPEVEIETLETGHSQVSKIIMGTHTGTHMDVPRHLSKLGLSLEQIPLATLIGPCRVVDFTSSEKYISLQDVTSKKIQLGERIIAKTKNSIRGYDKFYEDYIYLHGDAAAFLANVHITLFGIDYLSINQKGSKDNRPHTELLGKNIPIFEGLNLKDVPEGNYTFIGLPLKLVDIDGAPSRVILIKND